MNPIAFAELAIKLYGRKKWKRELAKALGTNASTIHRLGSREEIPGVYEVALKGLLQHKRAQHILDRDARAKERKLHPKPRKRVLIPPAPKDKIDEPVRDRVAAVDSAVSGPADADASSTDSDKLSAT